MCSHSSHWDSIQHPQNTCVHPGLLLSEHSEASLSHPHAVIGIRVTQFCSPSLPYESKDQYRDTVIYQMLSCWVAGCRRKRGGMPPTFKVILQGWIVPRGTKEPTCWCKRHKEMQPPSLGREDPPEEEGMAICSSILAWRIPMDRGAWGTYSPRGRRQLGMTEAT